MQLVTLQGSKKLGFSLPNILRPSKWEEGLSKAVDPDFYARQAQDLYNDPLGTAFDYSVNIVSNMTATDSVLAKISDPVKKFVFKWVYDNYGAEFKTTNNLSEAKKNSIAVGVGVAVTAVFGPAVGASVGTLSRGIIQDVYNYVRNRLKESVEAWAREDSPMAKWSDGAQKFAVEYIYNTWYKMFLREPWTITQRKVERLSQAVIKAMGEAGLSGDAIRYTAPHFPEMFKDAHETAQLLSDEEKKLIAEAHAEGIRRSAQQASASAGEASRKQAEADKKAKSKKALSFGAIALIASQLI